MSAIRSSENQTEVALRRAIHSFGFRFRKYASLIGRPDIVFAKERVAVFVDGDYWHARVLRERGPWATKAALKTPNKDYWLEKFQRRIERDDMVTATLRSEGWLVLRFWESEVKSDVLATARRIVNAVRRRRRIG